MIRKISQQEKLSLIRINSFSYLRTDWFNMLLQYYESAENILKQKAEDIAENGHISISTAKTFLKEAFSINPEEEMEKTQKVNGRIVFNGDEDYPQLLHSIEEPPLLLYIRGNISNNIAPIAMVGTRKPTSYGKRCAEHFASDVSTTGIVIVSGMARGIDTIVQTSSVKLKKPTWAVVGTGIGRCYPAENIKLAKEIIETGGAIISELPFDKPPLAFHFPRRNRIIAGISILTAVIEGDIRSGSLITAKMALEQGKEVLAVPGNIDSKQSQGTNALIRQGALALVDSKNIIDAIPIRYRTLIDKKILEEQKIDKQYYKEDDSLSTDEKNILELLLEQDLSVDEITDKLNFDIATLSQILFSMELKNIITCKDGVYCKNKFR